LRQAFFQEIRNQVYPYEINHDLGKQLVIEGRAIPLTQIIKSDGKYCRRTAIDAD